MRGKEEREGKRGKRRKGEREKEKRERERGCTNLNGKKILP
jgi:hypothetical protein